MRARYQTSDIEEFDWYGAAAFDAGAIVWFTAVCETETCAGAFDLEVANGALRVDCCEAECMSGCDPTSIRNISVIETEGAYAGRWFDIVWSSEGKAWAK